MDSLLFGLAQRKTKKETIFSKRARINPLDLNLIGRKQGTAVGEEGTGMKVM